MNNQIKLFLSVILFSLVILVVACNSASTPEPTSTKSGSTWHNIQEIEGCEYIEIKDGILDNSVYGIAHKGNCKNPIHCYNKVERKDDKK